MTTAAASQQPSSLTRLRAACRTLFARQGFHHTRPQDIAAEAGVANGTFYLHFKDKQEAFLDFSQQAQDELRALYAARLDGVVGQRDRWEVIFNAMLDFAEQQPGVLLAAFMDPLFVAPNHENAWELYERMGHFVEMAVGDAAAYEQVTLRMDTELVSHALCGACRHAMIYAYRKQMPREQLVAQLLGFIDRAMELSP